MANILTVARPDAPVRAGVHLRLPVAALALLLLLALGVRLAVFDRFLPVIDHYDESLRFLHAYSIRPDSPLGVLYGVIEWEAGFPPFQPWFTGWVQRAVEARMLFPLPSDYIYVMRLVSVALGVLTTALLAGIGWMLGRPLGAAGQMAFGGAAALPWALSPIIVATSSFALLDPLLFPMVIAALWCAVYAIQQDSPWATVGSLAWVILAIYTKYVAIYALWLPGAAVVMLLHRRGWRRALPWLMLMALGSALGAAYLVFGYGALGLENREANQFRSSGLEAMFSPWRNLDNLAFTIDQTMGLGVFLVVLAAGTAGYVYSRRRGWRVVEARWLWLLIPFILGCTLLTSSVDVLSQTHPRWYRIRYMLPPAGALSVIWAGALAQAVCTVRAAQQGRRGLSGLALAAALLAFSLPALAGNLAAAQRFAAQHGLIDIWSWADASLRGDEGRIMSARESNIANLWNRPYSGYNGRTSFDWLFDSDPTHSTPLTFYTDYNVAYFVATSRDLETVYNTPAERAWIDQLLFLKTIPPGAEVDFSTNFYRLIPPQVQTEAVFGDQIRLVGYDLAAGALQPGDTLTLRPYWQALRQPDTNYSLFVHLRPTDSLQPVAQYDGTPVSERRLPLTWTDPAETLIGVDAQLTLPADLPAGEYTLVLGLYDFISGARLTLADGQDVFEVAALAVE